jgi:hypothetical protein
MCAAPARNYYSNPWRDQSDLGTNPVLCLTLKFQKRASAPKKKWFEAHGVHLKRDTR